ncbi:MAG TPA: Ig-like domain-containing protein [Candidatus Paceibacterota bacterium]|nr:Ig-like domain-containing protein [Candidatus Paceibacterota bacterium]
MRITAWALLLLAMLPLPASAAGFAKESLFLSKTPVTEGETVLIHAVVANEGADKFTGSVKFADEGVTIGSVAVTISPGGAAATSISWKPGPGSHPVTAELTDPAGAVVEKESATFKVDAKPKPASSNTRSSAAAVESSQDIQDGIEKYSPAAANAAAPVFNAIDSARSKAADALDSGIEWAKDTTGGKKPGEVLGASTADPSPSGIMGTLWFFLATISLYLFTILRFLVGSAGIFYPLLAILFFFVLWRTYKRFRRPSYAY